MAGASSKSAADADIEKLLNREASAFQREVEVERILTAFKLKCVPLRCQSGYPNTCRSPYDILDLDETATPEMIKKKYRQLSLCEHPCLHLRSERISLYNAASTELKSTR